MAYTMKGDLSGMAAVLTEHPSLLDKPLTKMDTALHLACRVGAKKVVQWLLTQPEINVNVSESSAGPPFLAACKEGHMEIIECLLQLPQLDPNLGSTYASPLVVAVRNGSEKLVETLLADKRVDPNQIVAKNTALAIALETKNLKVFRLLLAHPAIDPNLRPYKQAPPVLLSSVRLGDSDGFLQALLEHPETNVNARNSFGATLLMTSIGRRHQRICKILIDNPMVAVNVPDNASKTPLFSAASLNLTQVFFQLLSRDGVDTKTVPLRGSVYNFICRELLDAYDRDPVAFRLSHPNFYDSDGKFLKNPSPQGFSLVPKRPLSPDMDRESPKIPRLEVDNPHATRGRVTQRAREEQPSKDLLVAQLNVMVDQKQQIIQVQENIVRHLEGRVKSLEAQAAITASQEPPAAPAPAETVARDHPSTLWPPLYLSGVVVTRAVGGFSADRRIGHTDFGEVFLGDLSGTLVAVTRLTPQGKNLLGQVREELPYLLRLQHPRFKIPFAGCILAPSSPQMGALVEAYASHGTLQQRLGVTGGSVKLPWYARLRIVWQAVMCLGAWSDIRAATPATGGQRVPCLHLRAEDILLEEESGCRVDILRVAPSLLPGAPRLSQSHKDYLAPELGARENGQNWGGEKTMIYSLGVVLAQILTGLGAGEGHTRPPLAGWFTGVVPYTPPERPAQEVFRLSQLSPDTLLEAELRTRWPKGSWVRLAHLVRRCLDSDPNRRPTIGGLVEETRNLLFESHKVCAACSQTTIPNARLQCGHDIICPLCARLFISRGAGCPLCMVPVVQLL